MSINNVDINFWERLILFLLLFLLSFCVDRSFSQTEGMIKIHVKIKDYRFGSLSFFTENGYGESYDGTVCEILDPPQYAGKELVIYHLETVEPESLWRNIGKVCSLIIDNDFYKMEHIFSGYVQEIKILNKPPSFNPAEYGGQNRSQHNG